MKRYLDKNTQEEQALVQNIYLTEYILTKLCLFFFSENKEITKRSKRLIRDLFNFIDIEAYKENEIIYARLRLLTIILQHFEKEKSILGFETYFASDVEYFDYHYEFLDGYKNKKIRIEGETLETELSSNDVNFVNNFISEHLKSLTIFKTLPIVNKFVSEYSSGDYGNSLSIKNDEYIRSLEKIVFKYKQSKNLSGFEAYDFKTNEKSFTEMAEVTFDLKSKPQTFIKTGCRLLNSLLNGGWEGSRIYTLFGKSGDWKSGLMLNAALWAASPEFNKSYILKDPTKKPSVLFISQENDMMENILRMVSYGLGSNVDISSFKKKEDFTKVIEDTFSNENCDFSFKYRPSRSITTAEIDTMIQDELIRGYEVIFVVHDYIKRIKAVEQTKERFIEFGLIVDEELSIAKKYNIPFLTAMQLNREAYRVFENCKTNDALLKIGPHNVGESINVYENSDYVIFLSRETPVSTEKQWLSLRRIKSRGKKIAKDISYFSQPYALNSDGSVNQMKLEMDAHLPERMCAGTLSLQDSISKEYVDEIKNGNSLEPINDSIATAKKYVRKRKKEAETPLNNEENQDPEHLSLSEVF